MSDVTEIYVFTAITLVATGVVTGIIAVVSLGIRREDRRGSRLPVDANDRITRGTRQLTGLYIRRPAGPERPSEPASAAGTQRGSENPGRSAFVLVVAWLMPGH